VVYPGPHLLELVKIRRVPGIGNDPPDADFGTRIFWAIIGEPTAKDKFRISAPPETGDDLPHSTFTHRKRFRFDFEGDSGKTVWFCIRYENSKGGKEGEGPFGPIFSAVIPNLKQSVKKAPGIVRGLFYSFSISSGLRPVYWDIFSTDMLSAFMFRASSALAFAIPVASPFTRAAYRPDL
jgi:hypothetical protein